MAGFEFEPKVWRDHIRAYFRKKLVFGAFAVVDESLATEPGLTVNFPFYKAIGDAEEPLETEGLTVDHLSDSSFTATVKEIGKAVSIKRRQLYKSADSIDNIMANAQSQIATRIAEKVDYDLKQEILDPSNSVLAFTAAAAADTMSVKRLLSAKLTGYGDRANDAAAIFMHSRVFLDLMSDNTAGFMKADANDPMFMTSGFQGRLMGMAIVITDQMPLTGTIDGRPAYKSLIVSPGSYGLMIKQELDVESDYDMLQREYVTAGTEWYAVKSFHGKVDAEDVRAVSLITTTGV